MSKKEIVEKEVYDLMWEIQKFTRTSLMLQHTIAQKVGLNATDAECLDFLMEMGPSTAGALAKATRLTTGAVTTMIDRLEKAGFVRRSTDPNDRRKVIVSVIPKRKAVIGAKYRELGMAVQSLLATYSKKDLTLLVRYTNALTAVFEKQIPSSL
ncbi:MAG TPA: MarR family transcriptional regulator [Puia sp.]|nr:MarR family transcriptional regulator [Puia sp.]